MSQAPIVFAVRFAEVPLRGPRLLRQAAFWLKREIDQRGSAAVVVGTSWRVAPGREGDRMRAAGDDIAAAMLAGSLGALGTRARSLDDRDVELAGDGAFGAGRLDHLDSTCVAGLVAAGVTPVLPGGHVRRPDGETVMLAHGGIDLTVVLLAISLGAASCHFVSGRIRSSPGAGARISPDALMQARKHGITVVRRSLDSSSFETVEIGQEGA